VVQPPAAARSGIVIVATTVSALAEVATLALPGVVLTYLCSRIQGVRSLVVFSGVCI
jgi:hypothetical protein